MVGWHQVHISFFSQIKAVSVSTTEGALGKGQGRGANRADIVHTGLDSIAERLVYGFTLDFKYCRDHQGAAELC